MTTIRCRKCRAVIEVPEGKNVVVCNICKLFDDVSAVKQNEAKEKSPEQQKWEAEYSNYCKKVAPVKNSILASQISIGLRSNGTVLAAGPNKDGQCNVSRWRDIVAIATSGWHTVGLRSDGTVVATGSNKNGYGRFAGQCDVSEWQDIVAIATGIFHTVGLKKDGTVVATGENANNQCRVFRWKDVTAIAAVLNRTIGIRRDGTVVATGDNSDGSCDVSTWRDITAISLGDRHTVGLCSDGTVISVGDNKYGQCNTYDWASIVDINAYSTHTVGLRSDGTVVATGNNEYGQCNVSGWNNIVAISAGAYHTVGLHADGTVVATGNNEHGTCNVSMWRDIIGVYEFDKERFCAKYRNIFDASGVFAPIVDKYLEILDMEEAVNEYHDYIAESRKNAWSGGGFGIGGAIKGHIKAQLLNYGNAFLHSIPDSGRRSRDEDKIRRMKAQLYKDPETLKSVIRLIYVVNLQLKGWM